MARSLLVLCWIPHGGGEEEFGGFPVALDGLGEGRVEWDAVDLVARNGSGRPVAIEVKSSAYVQTWSQDRHSTPVFGVGAARQFVAGRLDVKGTRLRRADVYVFCLLECRDKRTANPLDVAQWSFYVAPRTLVDQVCGSSATLKLTTLQAHPGFERVGFDLLRTAVWNAAGDPGPLRESASRPGGQ